MKVNKFRFWVPSLNRIIYPHENNRDQKFYIELPTFNLTEFSIEEGYQFFEVRYNDVIPMQYINLNDKNGKEIYEGDILKFYKKNYNVISEYTMSIKSDMEPSCGCFDYFYGYVLEGITYIEDIEKYGSIIGNIYENPELIES